MDESYDAVVVGGGAAGLAGSLAAINAQVISSAAAGLTAGAVINADLAAEDARHAVDAHRRQHAHAR